ncbi:MAG: hypothetical protein E7576_13285 [Ruminococcaceae bacterium]|jgi:Asp-tRNA(Asn)/Glu-tRNA(Gln) amidotransferase C subunit|nr:hypothetical protein [Oscillospiraceae bacterium]
MNETNKPVPEPDLKKLTASAMLALSPEAEKELARDFEALKVRLDGVVQSEAASGEPAEGPIHAGVRRVLPPDQAEEKAAERPPVPCAKGKSLLSQADRFDGTFCVVPRVV